jgi:hypothetical protein
MGYVAESTFRFSGIHNLFGRIERVGSDELLRENESLERRTFRMNKVTFGYFRDIRASPTLAFDVGLLASRYLIPSDVADAYGKKPLTGFLFIRVRLN